MAAHFPDVLMAILTALSLLLGGASLTRDLLDYKLAGGAQPAGPPSTVTVAPPPPPPPIIITVAPGVSDADGHGSGTWRYRPGRSCGTGNDGD